MLASLVAAIAASIAPQAQATASGAGGVFNVPTPSAVPDGKAQLALGLDFWRGGDFLLPGATTQRTGATLSGSLGWNGLVEVFGALSLRSTNLFSSASRRTLVSAGDADLGVKLLMPGEGPISAGVLLQLDVPSGVGGFSLKGVGGRAAAMLGYAARLFRVSGLLGYRADNSGRLVSGVPATFPAFALNLSSYDAVQGGATLEAPLRYATPAAEISLESPVARRVALPGGDRPLRARLAIGLTQVRTGVPGLTFAAALQLSLTRAGRIDERELPAPGFSPDAPWTALAGLTWTFDRPTWHREVEWREPLPAPLPPAPSSPAIATPPRPKDRAVLRVVVLDAKTQLPIAGAWVSFLEGSDVGGTTGPDGKVRLEAEAGGVTLAVARDGYELLTDSVSLAGGEERQLTISLQPVAPDATLRGRIAGEDGQPLRAAVVVSAAGTLPALPATPAVFEGTFSIPVQHGTYEVNAVTPGHRSVPIQVTLRPGETVSRDLELRRVAGEPRVRAGPGGLEFSHPISFSGERIQPASLPMFGELAQALQGERRPLEIVARVDPSEAADEAEALRISNARARAVLDALRSRGVRADGFTARGAGHSQPGQPLLELKVMPPENRPRAALPGSGGPP